MLFQCYNPLLMDATVQVALTGAVAGVVAALVNGVIAPRISWGIERRREELRYRKDHIHAWRQLVVDLAEHYKSLPDSAAEAKEHPLKFLNRSTAFLSLRKRLTPTAERELSSDSYEHICDVLADEIARIEKEWRLL